jgi:hypothetical protein
MALRKIFETPANTTDGTSRVAKVHKDSETGEFRCRLYVDGKAYEPADAFETDKEAAEDTARIMVMTPAQRALAYGEPVQATDDVIKSAPEPKRPRGYRCAPSNLIGMLLTRI